MVGLAWGQLLVNQPVLDVKLLLGLIVTPLLCNSSLCVSLLFFFSSSSNSQCIVGEMQRHTLDTTCARPPDGARGLSNRIKRSIEDKTQQTSNLYRSMPLIRPRWMSLIYFLYLGFIHRNKTLISGSCSKYQLSNRNRNAVKWHKF